MFVETSNIGCAQDGLKQELADDLMKVLQDVNVGIEALIEAADIGMRRTVTFLVENDGLELLDRLGDGGRGSAARWKKLVKQNGEHESEPEKQNIAAEVNRQLAELSEKRRLERCKAARGGTRVNPPGQAGPR